MPILFLSVENREGFAVILSGENEAKEIRQAQKARNWRSGQIQPVFRSAFVKCIIP
jgi:hypothetical protein